MAVGAFLLAGASLIGGLGKLFGGSQEASGLNSGARSYRRAADLATNNAAIAAMSSDIGIGQLNRKAQIVMGGQRADIAASGLKESGSALDVIRQSRQDAALDRAMTTLQGQMNVTDWFSRAYQFSGQADSMESQAGAKKAEGIGGFLGSALTAASFFI